MGELPKDDDLEGVERKLSELEGLAEYWRTPTDADEGLFTNIPQNPFLDSMSNLLWLPRPYDEYMLNLGKGGYFIIRQSKVGSFSFAKELGDWELWEMPRMPAEREMKRLAAFSDPRKAFAMADKEVEVKDNYRWNMLIRYQPWHMRPITEDQRREFPTEPGSFFLPPICLEKARLHKYTRGVARTVLNRGTCDRNTYWDGPPPPWMVDKLLRNGLPAQKSRRGAVNLLRDQ